MTLYSPGAFLDREIISHYQPGALKIQQFLDTYSCYHFCGIADNYRILRVLSSYNAAGSNDAIVTYCCAIKNYAIGSHKDVVSYFDPAENTSAYFTPEYIHTAVMGNKCGAACDPDVISYLNKIGLG
jgi:hypothetical protein